VDQPSARSAVVTNAIPPALWKSFTSPARWIDAGDQRHRRGKLSKSSQSMTIPAARAIAGKWIAWLVEPPVASSPTMGVDDRLFVDALQPSGAVLAAASSASRCTAARVSACAAACRD
jgi:hypothetical protein